MAGFPGGLEVKNPLGVQEMQEMQVQSLIRADPREDEAAAHSWTEEPDGL